MSDLKIFFSKVSDKTNTGCMEWMGAINEGGYGTLTWKGKGMTLAHRLSYELHHGKIPPKMCVCHSCDNRKCVNPDHLWVGTIKDNNLDMIKKGRANLKRGTRLWSKLTEYQVKEIRDKILSGISMVELSITYNVSDRTINDINKGKLWSSIDTAEHKEKRLIASKKTKSLLASKNNSKLNEVQIKKIKKKLANGETQRSIANEFGVSQFCIFEIKHGKRWKDI